MRRLASAAVITTLALATLSGCFLLPEAPTSKPEPSEAIAEADAGFGDIGDCWETNYTDMAEWSVWEGDGPVDCDDEHQSYTYFVGELSADVEEAWSDGDITAELQHAVATECAPHLLDLGIPDSAARAGGYFFVTDEDDWADGDHRIRCDVAVSALDSDWNSPDLEELPADIADLVDDVDAHARAYELCLIGDGYGPYDSSEAYYADCAGDYFWRFTGTVDYPADAADSFPGDDAVAALADSECTALGLRNDETLLPYGITEDMWDAGYRSISCWASLIEQPSESAPI